MTTRRQIFKTIFTLYTVYAYIIKHKTENDGNSPTLRDIGNNIGIKSTSHVSYYINKLVDIGLIRRKPTRAGSIEVVGGEWRMGSVR